MIVRYNHKSIDRDKYTTCLQNSTNYRIYGELWYLDIVSPFGYYILVLNDFEAIMPMPYLKKIGLKFITQPTLCQQLGVFYLQKIASDDFNLFFSYLKKYRVRSYNFNEENTEFFYTNEYRKNNQLLFLNNSYDTIFNNFERDKKKLLNRDSTLNLKISESFNISDFEDLCKQNCFPYFNSSQLSTVKNLLINANHKKLITQYTVQNLDDSKSVFLWTLNSRDRIIIILSTRIKEIEINGSFVFLLNYLIRKFSNSQTIIDFEGSMIPGVAKFNQSLGAITNQYISYKNFKWFELFK